MFTDGRTDGWTDRWTDKRTDKQMDGKTNMTIYKVAISVKNLGLIQPSFICYYIPDAKLHNCQTTEVLNCSTTKLLTNTYCYI